MARSRNIKPGFYSNDELAEVEPLGRILFSGLWTIADREGRLEDRPKRIKASILPYDDCDVDDLLQDLNDRGFIQRYAVAACRYIAVTNWKKHQQPHPREVESEIPAPGKDEGTTGHNLGCDEAQPRKTPGNAKDMSGNALTNTLTLSHSDSSHSDSGEPPTADVRPHAREPANRPKPDSGADAPPSSEPSLHPFALLEALCDEQGQDTSVLSASDRGKQLAVAKRLVAAGMTEADLRRMTRWLLSQAWVTGGVDLFLVEKQHAKWQLAGKPKTGAVNSRASPGSVAGPGVADANGFMLRRKDGGYTPEGMAAMALAEEQEAKR